MSGKFVRASKYRHVFGQAAKKELCYENLKITKNAWDSNIIQTNGTYLSVNWDASGGGAFAVIPLNEVGKAPDKVPLFRGHTGPVLDTSFNPFNKRQIASCSDDGKICLWNIPEDYSFHKPVDGEDGVQDILEPTKVLSGHTRKVGRIEFHPCVDNILASSSMDYSVKIWNLESGKDEITLQHKDLVTSFAFNYNGSLLATTSRDKKLRIWDIRSGKIISEGDGHTGAKPSRVVWLGNTDRIITTGFSRLSDRQVGIWDIHDINKGPIDGFIVIDASSGVLIPFYDAMTSILYLAGKGDGNIRYYEYENDILHELSQYSSTDPQRGFAVTPKNAVNVKENEIYKTFKTVKDHCIEPISFIVPRRSELFQEDIYPDCPSNKPAMTAEEWLSGGNVNGPILMSVKALYEGTTPSLRDSEPIIAISEVKQETERKKKEEAAKVKIVEKKVSLVPEEPSEVKNVDELLKSSEKVNSLLNKVNDITDDEINTESNDLNNDEDWEEVKKPVEFSPAVNDSTEKEISHPAATESPVAFSLKDGTREPKTEISPEPCAKMAMDSSKAEVEKDKTEITSPIINSTQANKVSGAPTLKATVEKLADLVEKLETQVSALTTTVSQKDTRLETLEQKIEELLKK